MTNTIRNPLDSLPRVVFVTGMCMSAVMVGCSHAPHKTHQQRAQEHWSEVRAQVKLQLAQQQYNSGLIDEATATIHESLTYDPNFAPAYVLLARCQLESGLVKAAKRSADHAAQTIKNDSGLMAIRGLVAERSGDLTSALGYYQKARQLDDEVVEYLLSEAECLVAMGERSQAVALLESQRQSYDQDASIHALIGEIALAGGDEQNALRSFRMALSGDVKNRVIAEQYILLAANQGECYDALQAADEHFRATDSEEAPRSLLCAMASCQLQLNRTESARKTIRDLLKRDPDDLESWRLMARIAVETDNASDMQHASVNIARLAPNDADAPIIRAYSLISQGDLSGAQAVLRRMVLRNNNDALGHCLLADVSEQLGRRDTAIVHYRRALEIDPQSDWPREALRRLEAKSPSAS